MDERTSLSIRYGLFTLAVLAIWFSAPDCSYIPSLSGLLAGVLLPTGHLSAELSKLIPR